MAGDRIEVSITAETSDLLDALERAQTGLGNFGEQVRGLGAQMAATGSSGAAALATEMGASVRLQAEAWRGALSEIDGAEAGFVRTLLSRRQSLSQSLMRLSAELAQREIASDLAWLTNKLLLNTLGLDSDMTTTQGGLVAHLLAEQEKTAATVTGVGERSAANQAGASTSLLADLGGAVQFIATQAAKTFAGVFAFLSPELGPAAAAPAAASEGAVMAIAGTLAAGGLWMVPSDNFPILAHAGESVLPANIAGPMRDFFAGGAAAGAVTFAPQVSAVDAKSVVALFNSPAIMRQFARNLSTYLAMNPSTRGAY